MQENKIMNKKMENTNIAEKSHKKEGERDGNVTESDPLYTQ